MARVTSKDVTDIIDTRLSNSNINIYIDVANRLVTDILGSDTTLSDAQKADIEKFFAAHLIASTKERQASEKEVREASIKYTGNYGEGLKLTSYGQMVEMLDTTGKMSDIGKIKSSIEAITSFA